MNVTYSILASTTPAIVIESDLIKIELSENSQKMFINPNDRSNNKQTVVEIERTLHRYHDHEITHAVLEDLSEELDPLIKELKPAIVAGVKL